ncbi:response regulator [Halobacteriovorax sp. GB3]|uniref:response regulator transcription factor n=1 Tax=Halobacteriovorax sp. GB3 TaxID=2719615 RepID=UPI00235F1583|nr:response regulator [Halobacteriovorax sp. GB3]MDD0851879.1 response regulator [Halobacteriovorax sp. GB3]
MRSIVLVDDETDMFPLFNIKFKKEIKKNEIKFIFFSSAQDALTFIKGTPPDKFQYIISDINMPNMDGLELLREIKDRDQHQKVYMISGQQSLDAKKEAKELGADGFLKKPINFQELKDLLLS